MAEGKILFSLDAEKFQIALNLLISRQPNCFNLQNEFKTKGVSLSQSLLIWTGESGQTWLLADFNNKKAYDIEEGNDAAGNQIVEVSERSSETEQPVTFEGSELICDHLKRAQGTNQGIIDLLRRLNIDELDLEELKRSDLSGAGFSFESVHQDLVTAHSMFLEILTSPYEWLLNLSRGSVESLKGYLPEFYENVQKIEDFEISGENPRQTYTNLLQDSSNFCGSVKESLGHIVAYLSSRKMEQLETKVDATVDAAVDKLNAETNRGKENNNEVERLRNETQQELNQLKRERQTQQAKESVTDYKEIFEKQAKEYRKGARIWLGAAGVATAVFFAAFVGLTIWLESEGSDLTGTLQNLFTKGFVLSPIYVWLNRSIKNHAAQKHLEVINTHREKALETFNRFYDAAQNQETQDAVLRSATDAIFDANQTGYLSTKGSTPDSRSPVQQVIREIIPDRSPPKS